MSHYLKYERWMFPANKISGGNIHLAASLLSSALEVNSFSVYVVCDDPDILNFKRNSELRYYSAPGRDTVWRVQDIERTAPSIYHISSTSTLGLLVERQHYGGIYTGETAEDVIKDICGTVPVIIKTNLRGIKLYGWLPIASARDNLSQVLFAIGAALKSDLDGILRIENLWDGISGSLGAERMYQESSVKYEAAVTSVVVMEHQYIQGSEEKTLYEGTALAGDIITFSEPMHSLTADGFTILDHGANWAKLSAGTGVLRGNAYIHNTREVVKTVHERQEPNVKTVKEATLVSLVNSEAAANRLKNFYQWRETIDAPIVYRGELPGDRMDTYHPFDKNNVGSCFQSADITLSNTLKAQVKSLVGFVPEQIEQIETYDFREVLTGSGEWEVPEGVEEVVAVLIGGGSGGHNGENAGHFHVAMDIDDSNAFNAFYPYTEGTVNESVSVTHRYSNTDKSEGKPGGIGGEGGYIYRVTRTVTPHEKIPYSCGAGGNPGESGGQTLFGEISSNAGSGNPIGYTDPITGEVFAVPGKAGSKGGDGGSPGNAGESVAGVSGGAGAAAKNARYGPVSSPEVEYDRAGAGRKVMWEGTYTRQGTANLGGLGGGGAGGNSGDNKGMPGGSAGSSNIEIGQIPNNSTHYYGIDLYVNANKSGVGGDGADGADGSNYGDGGNGGGGAGATGQFGNSTLSAMSNVSVTVYIHGNTSYGMSAHIYTNGINISSSEAAHGGIAGHGAPGCIILYYGTKEEKQSGQFVDRNEKIFLDKYGRRFIV